MSDRQQKDKNEGMDMRERKEKMKGEARTEDGGSKNRGHPIGYADGGRKTQRRDRAVF